ncbi:MAG TPA: FAD-dependent thymidylate synthase, partial [bacterium]
MERIRNQQLEEILGKEFPCLDHGFVRLMDYMGSDESIVQAARVSYGKGTKHVHQDRGLIRYLMRHQHTTPFEMVEFKFHCKLPI